MDSKLIQHPIIIKLLEKYRILWALNHVSALAHWDLETYMPKEGAKARGEALSKIASLSQSLFLDKTFVDLIEQAAKETGLNEYELAVVRLLKRSLKYYQKLPPEFIEDFVKTTSEATVVWRNAKEKSDFSLFEPYLEKIVQLARKKAEYLGYKEHPYDALLDDYEEGLTTKDAQNFFDSIKNPIVELINYVKNSKNFKHEHPLEHEEYDVEQMKKFTEKLLQFIHYNMDHIRIDTSSHPFSIYLGPGDQRITTRYEGKDFASAYSSAIHEYGHALYNLQSHEDLHYTPISGGNSVVIHESQSRFWENFLGRSKEFIKFFYEDIIKIEKAIGKYSVDDIYEYLNLVRPSLIRTEADEVTYHLHVLIRFEIEKGLIEGSIQVKDVPKVWNEKYKKYLGVEPKNDSQGVLQDIHWSDGSIGYFPTYSLGTALSAMWKHKMEKDIGKISDLLKDKEGIKKIQDWLKKNIHQYGSTYTFKELVRKTSGEDFNIKYLIEYLENKYKNLY